MPSRPSPTPLWKRWYKTARWQALRLTIFQRDLFTCQRPECGHLESSTALLVCDHKVPHRGDERLFWDENNLQTLCKACHDKIKQRDEQSSLHTRGVWH
ncbi:HNH endonuclease [Bradyrhizobium liaoningense]|nr:HNH endonuclease [Bradyrhizobium liaoningense]